jgi:hypothetical protein
VRRLTIRVVSIMQLWRMRMRALSTTMLRTVSTASRRELDTCHAPSSSMRPKIVLRCCAIVPITAGRSLLKQVSQLAGSAAERGRSPKGSA